MLNSDNIVYCTYCGPTCWVTDRIYMNVVQVFVLWASSSSTSPGVSSLSFHGVYPCRFRSYSASSVSSNKSPIYCLFNISFITFTAHYMPHQYIFFLWMSFLFIQKSLCKVIILDFEKISIKMTVVCRNHRRSASIRYKLAGKKNYYSM